MRCPTLALFAILALAACSPLWETAGDHSENTLTGLVLDRSGLALNRSATLSEPPVVCRPTLGQTDCYLVSEPNSQ